MTTRKFDQNNKPQLVAHYDRWVIASDGVKETSYSVPLYAQGGMSSLAQQMLRAGVIVELIGGQILMTREGGDSWVFLVLTGILEVVLCREDGEELEISQRRNGDLVGELGMLSVSSGNIRLSARNRVRCVRVHSDSFIDILNRDPNSMRVLHIHLARNLVDTTRKLESMVFETVRQKVYRQLVMLCNTPRSKAHEDGILVYESRAHIARSVGATRESVGRALKSLHADGFIVLQGGRILVRGHVVPTLDDLTIARV